MQPEKQECYEIEESCPKDSIVRSQHAGRNDGCDRIGRVVQAVQKIKEQRDPDKAHKQGEGKCNLHQTFSITIPLISLATSSKRSTTFSSSP